MTDRCKRCGLPQIDYPLYVDEKGFAIEPKETVKKISSGDFKGFQWVNLFKMKLRDILFIVILLSLAFSYNLDVKTCNDFQENPCDMVSSVAYSGMCNLRVDRVIQGNSIYEQSQTKVGDYPVGNWSIP